MIYGLSLLMIMRSLCGFCRRCSYPFHDKGICAVIFLLLVQMFLLAVPTQGTHAISPSSTTVACEVAGRHCVHRDGSIQQQQRGWGLANAPLIHRSLLPSSANGRRTIRIFSTSTTTKVSLFHQQLAGQQQRDKGKSWITDKELIEQGVMVRCPRGGATSSSPTSKRTSPTTAGAGTISSSSSSFVPLFLRTIMEARRDLVAAAVARCTSILLMYPVDTIKTRVQMEQPSAFRLNGIYKGVTGSLLGQVPYGVLTFGSYETYKRTLLGRYPHIKPIFVYAISAVLGDLTGSGWLCPSEVIKQKMQAGMYPNTIQAVQSVWKNKGLLGFYEGYLGGITRDVPFRVAQLTSYEVTKAFYQRIKQGRHQQAQQKKPTTRGKTGTAAITPDMLALAPAEAALCGAIAGTFAAAITAPLDRIKTLLMTNSGAYGGSVLSCAAKIWRDEGIAGLTTGVVPRVTYIAPSVAIFFIAYEQVQQRLKHWQVPVSQPVQKR